VAAHIYVMCTIIDFVSLLILLFIIRFLPEQDRHDFDYFYKLASAADVMKMRKQNFKKIVSEDCTGVW
jgi:hypothetical protein